MTIVVECGTCGRRSGAKDEWVGRRVKCPGCGQLVEIPPPAAPPAQAQPLQARPLQALPPQARPAQARPLQARPVQARPARQAQSPPQYASAAPAPEFAQPAAASILDLLGDQSASGAAGPLGGQFGNPLGFPPPKKRRGKSSSNKTVWFIIAGAGFAMALCGGIIVAILVPALQAARVAAQRAQFQQWQAPGRPAASGGWFKNAPTASTTEWGPNPLFAGKFPTSVTFDQYSLQLPSGFASQPVPREALPAGVRAQSYVWGGPQSLTGAAAVGVDVIDITTGVIRPQEIDFILTTYLQTVQNATPMSAFQSDPAEKGLMAGKPSIRARFRGTVLGRPMRGIAYVILDNKQRTLRTFALCPEGHTNPSFDFLEAAMLTLRLDR